MPPRTALLRTFAFGVLPTIIFFSALMSILYHLGVMQLVGGGLARVMRGSLGTSGAETFSAAANVFAGQTEPPLDVRPYVNRITMSVSMVVLAGGIASIVAGSVAMKEDAVGIGFSHLGTRSTIGPSVRKSSSDGTAKKTENGNMAATIQSSVIAHIHQHCRPRANNMRICIMVTSTRSFTAGGVSLFLKESP